MMHPAVLPQIINWRWLWLTTASLLAGGINAVAGGGSFLLFPAIMSMRVLPVQANATNSVALWPGQFTSIVAYWKDIRKNLRHAWPLALAGFLGGSAGALILLHTPQRSFLYIVPWLLLGAALLFAISGPVSRQLALRRSAATGPAHRRRLPVFLAALAVCFYIGYFGAGAGFLIITMLSLSGWQDMHEINALKVVAITLARGMAILMFVVSGQVVWRYCALAMVICAAAGYISAHNAHRIPQRILRTAVVCIGFGMSIWFFVRTP
jgi:hypothetical protein